MNYFSKFLILFSFVLIISNDLYASQPANRADKDSTKSLIDNINLRFMLRSEVKGIVNSHETDINYSNKPAMIAAGFDMGEKFSFYSRYRFDFPTDIQKDGTPVSLLAFNVQYKPRENMRFVVGKQVMLQGSWEFEYNPIDVYYYSLMGNHVQAFVSGVAFHYNIKKHDLAFQVSKVVDKEYLWNESSNGWNGTLYYSANYKDGFYKPIWSYTYTVSGEGKSLHNVMMGNQFNIDRFRIEIDAMAQNAYRYYGEAQQKTNESSLIGKVEYLLPNDRLSIAAKHAYDSRQLAYNNENVTKEHTTSLQTRYFMSKKYGVNLHSTIAYRINNTPEKYRNLFSGDNNLFFSLGVTWDFNYPVRR